MQGKETVLDDYSFLVSQTNEKGVITFVNDDFCKIAEYTVEELTGKPHNIIRHPDMPKIAFKGLWDTIQKDEIWTGYVKNMTKSKGFYWVYATVYPLIDRNGDKAYMSCRRKANKEEIETYGLLYEKLLKDER